MAPLLRKSNDVTLGMEASLPKHAPLASRQSDVRRWRSQDMQHSVGARDSGAASASPPMQVNQYTPGSAHRSSPSPSMPDLASARPDSLLKTANMRITRLEVVPVSANSLEPDDALQSWIRDSHIQAIIDSPYVPPGEGLEQALELGPNPVERGSSKATPKVLSSQSNPLLFSRIPETADIFHWPRRSVMQEKANLLRHSEPPVGRHVSRASVMSDASDASAVAGRLLPRLQQRMLSREVTETAGHAPLKVLQPKYSISTVSGEVTPTPILRTDPEHQLFSPGSVISPSQAQGPEAEPAIDAPSPATSERPNSRWRRDNSSGRWTMFQKKPPLERTKSALMAKALGLLNSGAPSPHQLCEHAFPDLLAMAVVPRQARTLAAKAALSANPEACNMHAAEQVSRLGKMKLTAARTALENIQIHPGEPQNEDGFFRAMHDVRFSRPFFHAPHLSLVQAKVKLKRNAVSASRKVNKSLWRIDSSIFARRKIESEGKAYFDGSEIYTKRAAVDWRNAIKKSRFRAIMARNDDDGVAGLKEELAEVQEVFAKWYPAVTRIFNYYCCRSSEIDESVFTLNFNSWRLLVKDFGLASYKSKNCKPTDCDNIFIATNFEEDPESAMGEANDDNALMRFEFLEALTRVAMLKYGKDQGLNDISDSVQMMMSECFAPSLISPSMPRELAIHPNVLRRRLYTEACAGVFEKWAPQLRSTYCLFKARERKKTLTIGGWLRCCDTLGWTLGEGGLSYINAKICFMWSQMCCTNEISKRRNLTTVTFVDFLECIARVAELMFPATPEQEDGRYHSADLLCLL